MSKKQIMEGSALSDFMPSKFSMIHAAADLILIIGVTVWLNGKINAISVQNRDAEIQDLQTQNQGLLEQNKVILEQNKILHERLQKVEQALQKMLEPEARRRRKSTPTHSSESDSEEEEVIST